MHLLKQIILTIGFVSALCLSAQNTSVDAKLASYLNFRSSLNNVVKQDKEGVKIYNQGKPEFTLYWEEQEVGVLIFTSYTTEQQIAFYNWKQNKKLNQQQLDSLKRTVPKAIRENTPTPDKQLASWKIAIDPGHIAGNMAMARVEQKYLFFKPDSLGILKDTIQIAEGKLTYQTAMVLKAMFKEQGADVFVTRQEQNYTAFGITYNDWLKQSKKKVLDSLLTDKTIDNKRHTKLMKLNKEKFFWEFFRDFELAERVRLINNYKPDLTLIVHYNVDEKNKDWLKPTNKNYTMTFMPGGITEDAFSKPINKVHFLRLLLSNQLEDSKRLCELTVNEFNKQLNIPIAKPTDATYLKDNCVTTSSKGVYCRNLALCRNINSPLVYGEALYQDNINECVLLNKNNLSQMIVNKDKTEVIQLPERVNTVAKCYYNAVINYVTQKK